MQNNYIRKQELAQQLGETKVKALDLYSSKELLGLSNEEIANACGCSRAWIQQLLKRVEAKEYLAIVEMSKESNRENVELSLYGALGIAKQHIYSEVQKGNLRFIEMLLKLTDVIEKIEVKEKALVEDCDIDEILASIERDFPTIDKCKNCKYRQIN